MSLLQFMENEDANHLLVNTLDMHTLCCLNMVCKSLHHMIQTKTNTLTVQECKNICDRTPFLLRKDINNFLVHGPSWLNGFIDLLRQKHANFDGEWERELQGLHLKIKIHNQNMQTRKRKVKRSISTIRHKMTQLKSAEAELSTQLARDKKQYEARIRMTSQAIELKLRQ